MVKLKKEWQIMKESEAIELIEKDLKLHLKDLSSKYKNGLRMAINALKKQIPKKPHKNFEKFSGVWCSCGKYLGKGYFVDKPSYCPYCGKKIKVVE